MFSVPPEVLEEYGAFNVALVNDLPLFVDPFLLYDSQNSVHRELHVMFRLTWFDNSADLDLNAEVNNGRGPVDFKVSKGKKNSNLVEFKLAKNTALEKNLQHQVAIYEKASDAKTSIKVIMYFNDSELQRVKDIIKRLKLTDCKDIVLIDASPKASASKADEH